MLLNLIDVSFASGNVRNKTGTEASVKPLYAARVSDLGDRDLVQLECACGHSELLTGSMLATAGMKPDDRVTDLQRRARCRECDEKGRAVVSIRWSAIGAQMQ